MRDAVREVQATPHQRYAAALHGAGLHRTALGREWLAAAERARTSPVDIRLPYREAAFHPETEASAAGYRFVLPRGRRLLVTIGVGGEPRAKVFVDLFRVPEDSLSSVDRVAGVDDEATIFTYEPRTTGTFVLRVQPELLRAARVTVALRDEPTLAFPVAGRDDRAIKSFYGAERDGGNRSHQGVDIFAPRGTPAVSAVNGVVVSTAPNALGGNVVFIRDFDRAQTLYYAHLDRQLVSVGERVQIGDTVGMVGNTGNARSTPPHLHFGIYVRRRGTVDPLPFLARGTDPPAVPATAARALGEWARLTSTVRPGTGELPRHTALRIVGVNGRTVRVRLPDGREHLVPSSVAEPATAAIARVPRQAARVLRAGPADTSPIVELVSDGASLPVLGRFAGYALVRGESGRVGWVRSGE